jgi:hypothetical protein
MLLINLFGYTQKDLLIASTNCSTSGYPKVYKAWQNKFNANEENYKSVVTSIRTQKSI